MSIPVKLYAKGHKIETLKILGKVHSVLTVYFYSIFPGSPYLVTLNSGGLFLLSNSK